MLQPQAQLDMGWPAAAALVSALLYAITVTIPNTMTMLGAGIVIASTLYITLREARLGTPKPASP